MVGIVVNVTTPVVILSLLNVMAFAPFIVATPAVVTLPVPLVNVPSLVRVPPADMFSVPAADQLKVPPLLFVNNAVVMDPEAEKVTVPLFVIDVEAVIEPAKLLTSRLMPVFTAIVAGGVAIAVMIVRLCAIVVVAPVGGTLPPSHEEAVAQSVAPVWVM